MSDQTVTVPLPYFHSTPRQTSKFYGTNAVHSTSTLCCRQTHSRQ